MFVVVVAVSVVAHVPTGPELIPREMAVFVSIVIFKHVFCGNMVFMFFHHVDECTKFAEVEQCITVNIRLVEHFHQFRHFFG